MAETHFSDMAETHFSDMAETHFSDMAETHFSDMAETHLDSLLVQSMTPRITPGTINDTKTYFWYNQ
jgi:hypothetical protein